METTPGIGHNHPPADENASIPIAPLDLKAARTAAKRLPEDFAFDKAKEAAKRDFEKADELEERGLARTRKGLQWLFQIYVSTAVDAAECQKLLSDCNQEKILLKAGTDVANAVVRYYRRHFKPETTNRYANVLREAGRRNVDPNKLATYLDEKGQRITDLHKARIRRNKSDHEVIEASDVNDEKSEATAVMKRNLKHLRHMKHCVVGNHVMISGEMNVDEFYPAEIGPHYSIWIRKDADESGTVIRVYRLAKGQDGQHKRNRTHSKQRRSSPRKRIQSAASRLHKGP